MMSRLATEFLLTSSIFCRAFLEKEYATENLYFVEAVWKMKKLASKDVAAGTITNDIIILFPFYITKKQKIIDSIHHMMSLGNEYLSRK